MLKVAAIVTRLGNFYVTMVEAMVTFCQRHARWVIGIALVLTASSVHYAVDHFAINTDTSQILSRDLPFQRIQNQMDAAFPQLNDTAVIVIDGDTGDLAEKAANRLSTWLQAQTDNVENVYEPGGGEFFRKNGLLYLDTKDLWSLSDRLSQVQPLISQVAETPTLPKLLSVLQEGLQHEVGTEPRMGGLAAIFDHISRALNSQQAGRFYAVPWDELITGSGGSEDDRRRFLIVKPRPVFKEIRPAQAAIATIEQGINTLALDPAHGVKVSITGSAALDNDQLSAVSRGTGIATTLAILLVLILLAIGLRSARQVFFTLATLFMGLSWTAAFALFSTGPLNLISVAFAVLFIGLGVDFGIQFCMRYQEEFNGRRSHVEALRRTAFGIGGSLTLAAVAAAISFYSFVPTSYAGIVDLGIISGTSMFFALFANITVLPALLTIRPVPTQRRRRLRRVLPLWRLPFNRYSRVIIITASLIAFACIPLIANSTFDFNPLHLQNANSSAVKTFEYLLRHSKASPYRIDILEPNLASADRAAKQLNRLNVVSQTITLSSFVPDHQAEKLDIIQQLALLMPPFTLTPGRETRDSPHVIAAALEHFRRTLDGFVRSYPMDKLAGSAQKLSSDIEAYIGRFKNAPAEFTALQSRIMDGLQTQLSNMAQALQAEPITLQNLPQVLRERYISPTGAARVEVLPSLDLTSNVNMRRFADAVRSVIPYASGAPVMLVEGGDAVVQAFIKASLISVVLITLLLILALRNIIDVLMVLIPLGIAAMLTVAAMSAFGISFNLANIIVLPLIIGLGVAFGIYLVVRWRSGVPVIRLLHTSTPEAVLFSALTTMSSFGSLALAGDPGMSVLGKTLTLGLASVLLSILILLPSLLMLRARSTRGKAPALPAR